MEDNHDHREAVHWRRWARRLCLFVLLAADFGWVGEAARTDCAASAVLLIAGDAKPSDRISRLVFVNV